jgi:ribosome recycling factor
MIKPVLDDLKKRMEKTIEDFQRELATIRTGRASISLLDHVMVNYYGTPTPINQVASLSVPEPTTILIQPWDTSVIGEVEKAILTSDLGINPTNDGKVIRLPIPPLTEERRKQLAKVVKNVAEQHRVAVRQIRHEGNDRLKKLLKDKKISEDDERNGLKKIQELTDTYIKKIDTMAKAKEDEVLKV